MARDITRRSYITSCTAAAGAITLAGCTGGDDDENGGESDGDAVELMHAWTGGDGAKAIEELENSFAEEHPDVERDFRAIGGEGNVELDATVASRLRDGNPPSVFAGWPGNNLVQYEDVLGDIEAEVWEEGNLKEAHVDEVVEFCQRPSGGMAAVPIGSHRMNDLFYSVGVLDEAGVDPDSIDSFDAFLDALDTIETETDAQPYVNGLASWINLQLFAVTMQGTQGFDAYMNFIEGNGDRAAVQETFENIEELLTNYLNPDVEVIAEINTRESFESFAQVLNTGHGVVGTTHAEDVETLVNRAIEQGVPAYLLREVDLVVFPRHVDGDRYVGEVVELVGDEEAPDDARSVQKDDGTIHYRRVVERTPDDDFSFVGAENVCFIDRLAARTDRPVADVREEFAQKRRYVEYLHREGVSDFDELFGLLSDLRTDEAATVERLQRRAGE